MQLILQTLASIISYPVSPLLRNTAAKEKCVVYPTVFIYLQIFYDQALLLYNCQIPTKKHQSLHAFIPPPHASINFSMSVTTFCFRWDASRTPRGRGKGHEYCKSPRIGRPIAIFVTKIDEKKWKNGVLLVLMDIPHWIFWGRIGVKSVTYIGKLL